MGKLIMIVGEQMDRLISMIRDVIPTEIAEFKGVKYDDSYNEASFEPDIVVFTDFTYKNVAIFKKIRDKYKDKKILLNADNEYLFENLATVDGHDKESYSIDCSWREYYAADLSIDEENKACKYEYYSFRHSRGVKVCFSCGLEDISDTVLILALSDMLSFNVYQAARSLEVYFRNQRLLELIAMKEEKVMMDLERVAGEMWANKISKGFNISDINFELIRLYGEVSELADAIWKKKSKEKIASEVADVFLYLLSVARMADVDDVEVAVYKKLIENNKRVYEKDENGVLVRVDDRKE